MNNVPTTRNPFESLSEFPIVWSGFCWSADPKTSLRSRLEDIKTLEVILRHLLKMIQVDSSLTNHLMIPIVEVVHGGEQEGWPYALEDHLIARILDILPEPCRPLIDPLYAKTVSTIHMDGSLMRISCPGFPDREWEVLPILDDPRGVWYCTPEFFVGSEPEIQKARMWVLKDLVEVVRQFWFQCRDNDLCHEIKTNIIQELEADISCIEYPEAI